ncbi:MAG: hypothetical protein ABJF04_18670 [Reichenbachiella sp.]
MKRVLTFEETSADTPPPSVFYLHKDIIVKVEIVASLNSLSSELSDATIT